MVKNNYTNAELAQHYFSVAAQLTVDSSVYRRSKAAIEASSVDIADFYRRHGTLSELDVKGIGPITRNTLELILGKGFEQAKEEIRAEKEARGWRRISRLVPRISDEAGPVWDNTVRSLEGD